MALLTWKEIAAQLSVSTQSIHQWRQLDGAQSVGDQQIRSAIISMFPTLESIFCYLDDPIELSFSIVDNISFKSLRSDMASSAIIIPKAALVFLSKFLS